MRPSIEIAGHDSMGRKNVFGISTAKFKGERVVVYCTVPARNHADCSSKLLKPQLRQVNALHYQKAGQLSKAKGSYRDRWERRTQHKL